MESNHIATKRHAVFTGLFFIAATVTAIIGLALYKPVLDAADPLTAAGDQTSRIAWGALFECLLAAANCGTAFMMLPVLSRVSRRLGPAYLIFRSLEVVSILVGAMSMLTLGTISTSALAQSSPEIGHALVALHDWTFVLGPHFMLGVNTFIYSSLFLRSGLVPRPLSLLGMVGASLIAIVGAVEVLGVISPYSATTMLMAIPIAVYEMILAVRLIAKGFDLTRIPPQSAIAI
ncbi:MAG: DUF4386 domain-containing protein [Flavobacteriales bacterium]|nr:DUF4386 domain-containing protein [Flavobacteriales bacterium]